MNICKKTPKFIVKFPYLSLVYERLSKKFIWEIIQCKDTR
jgi:hypothetical protein